VIEIHTVMHDISSRLTIQTSRVDNVESQLENQIKNIVDVLSQFVDKIDKLQPPTTLIPSSSSSPTSHVERIILVHTSTPYQHPNAHSFDNSQ
jgi:acetolactate synthase small subunit